MAHSGIELSVNRGPNGIQVITITRKDGNRTVTETVTTDAAKLTPKRPRLESAHRPGFEDQVALLSEWFDKTEVNLELLTTEPDNPKERLTLEEQWVLIQVRTTRCHRILLDALKIMQCKKYLLMNMKLT